MPPLNKSFAFHTVQCVAHDTRYRTFDHPDTSPSARPFSPLPSLAFSPGVIPIISHLFSVYKSKGRTFLAGRIAHISREIFKDVVARCRRTKYPDVEDEKAHQELGFRKRVSRID